MEKIEFTPEELEKFVTQFVTNIASELVTKAVALALEKYADAIENSPFETNSEVAREAIESAYRAVANSMRRTAKEFARLKLPLGDTGHV